MEHNVGERRKRSRVLAVDDDPSMLDVMRRVLARDYDLTLARDGEEGLRLALAAPPDLILHHTSPRPQVAAWTYDFDVSGRVAGREFRGCVIVITAFAIKVARSR